jgi:multiple sugar transport system ATP-binding protein
MHGHRLTGYNNALRQALPCQQEKPTVAGVSIKNITKIYPGNVKAVDDITLDIADAEFIVLVGPSGCGKTTTLRMIAGLEQITAGTISIGNRQVNDLPPKDRDIAMVFQNYALYPHMTVYKNMAFGLKLRHFSKVEIDKRVNWAAEILGLEDLLNRKPKALSGGQRQRVAVGRAIVRQPKAFLFDEPLSNLDAKLRVETRAELKRLHKRLQTTTIYVTHDQEEAMTLGERVVVMDAGVIQQCDTPISVYNQPANRFVAGFLGTPPMNFLFGSLKTEGSDVWFDGDGTRLKLLPQTAAMLGDQLDQEVVLGIRPEIMRLQAEAGYGEDAGHRIKVQINVVEPLGSSMDLFADTSEQETIIARVPADSQVTVDSTVTLHLDMTRLHVFEPGEYGTNLTRPETRVATTALVV